MSEITPQNPNSTYIAQAAIRADETVNSANDEAESPADKKGAKQSISGAKEDLFAPKIKFSPRQRQALAQLPSKELYLILDWIVDSRQKSPFDYIYSNNNNLPCPKAELQNKSNEEILRIIEAYIPADSGLAKDINNKVGIISSGEFTVQYIQIKDKLQPDNDTALYHELFKIFAENTGASDRNTYISALKTKEFKNFCQMIKTDYGANPFYNLLETLNLYLFPAWTNALRSDQTRAKIAILHEGMRDVDPSFFVSTSNIKIIKWLSAEQIKEKISYYGKIINLYPYKITDKNGLNWLLGAENNMLKALANPAAKENIWNYINKYYPEKLKYNSFGEFLSDFSEAVIRFKSLNITSQEADELLQLFSTDIGNFGKISMLKFKKITSADTKRVLAEKQNFQRWLNELYEKYPALKGSKNDIEKIENITLAYINNDQFLAINGAAEKLNGGERLARPEINAENHELKTKILNAIAEKNLETIVIDPAQSIFSNKAGAEFLNKIFEKINNGTLEKLYSALTNAWGLKYIELDQVFDILANNCEDLYLNNNNAAEFTALKNKYTILFDKKANKDTLENLKDLPYNLLAQLLNKAELLRNDSVKDYVFTHFAAQCETYNGKTGITLSNLASLNIPAVMKNPDSAGEIAGIARRVYGFGDADVNELLGVISVSNDYPNFADSIKKPETLQAFNRLKQMFSFSKAALLLGAVKTASSPDGIRVFAILKDEFGHEISDKKTFNYVLKFILSDESIAANLCNPDFIAFYKKTIGRFYNNTQKINTIPALSQLYDAVKGDSAARELLFSEKYQETVSWLRTEFGMTDLDSHTLVPILKIAKNIEKIKALIKRLNGKTSANDLLLLAAAAEHPEYEELLFDRDKMLRELGDGVRVAAKKSRQKKDAAGRKQKERLPLEQCSNMQLLRMVLLKRALRDKDFLAQTGKIAAADIKDATSEYGGGITIDDNGQPKIKMIRCYTTSGDHTYSNEEYPFLINGVLDFHYHPFPGERKDGDGEGPSGAIVNGGERYAQSDGDLACAEFYDANGVVFSIVNDPKKNNGKITINTCFYYADKRDPQNPQEAVFNMGNSVVDLPVE